MSLRAAGEAVSHPEGDCFGLWPRNDILGNRQHKPKPCPLPHLAFHPDAAVMGLNDAFGYCQTQTGSAGFAAAALFATKELLKNVG